MPELPDISAYLNALDSRIVGQPLQGIRLNSAFLLRTAQPPVTGAIGHDVRELRRIGKRIAIGIDNDFWLVLHLMIAGRSLAGGRRETVRAQQFGRFRLPQRLGLPGVR